MNLNPAKTAVLTLDLQQGIFAFVPGAEEVLPPAVKVVEAARAHGIRIIHVGLGFAEGHPEISDKETRFKQVKENNAFVIGSSSAEFHPSVIRPDELIVYKHRVSAFTENQLHLILRSQGIETLVLLGIATSGIVLSTLRRAFDLDFYSIVISDACFDRDPEVHRVLTEKVFTAQATVLTADAFISQLNESTSL